MGGLNKKYLLLLFGTAFLFLIIGVQMGSQHITVQWETGKRKAHIVVFGLADSYTQKNRGTTVYTISLEQSHLKT